MHIQQQPFKVWILAQAQDLAGLAAIIGLIVALSYLGLAVTPEVKPV